MMGQWVRDPKLLNGLLSGQGLHNYGRSSILHWKAHYMLHYMFGIIPTEIEPIVGESQLLLMEKLFKRTISWCIQVRKIVPSCPIPIPIPSQYIFMGYQWLSTGTSKRRGRPPGQDLLVGYNDISLRCRLHPAPL